MAQILLVRGDITRHKVDAIVNAANTKLKGGGGVDGAIHKAGGPVIMEACQQLIKDRGKNLKPGEAVITTAGNLPARFVIHTAGPIWKGGDKGEAKKLAECYQNSLRLAHEYGLASISFPNISTGVYKYPKEEAAEIAIGMIRNYIEAYENINVKEIQFVCHDEENFQIYRQRMKGEAISI